MNSNATVAIVGLGCILPDAMSPSDAWANFLRGHSSLRPLSAQTYDWSHYKRDSAQASRVFEGPVGAEIEPHPFDWRKFKISPLDAQAINPMHLHVLEAGAQVIEEVKNLPHATTGVFIGATGLGWRLDSGMRIRLREFLGAADRAGDSAGIAPLLRQKVLDKVRHSLEQRLRPVSDDGVVNSLASIAAGRLALRFDLRGPHAGIDAGFASGLAAIGEAVRLLRDKTIDLAIAGAASERISPLEILAFHELAVLARSQVRPFDTEANGTQLGEGVALFALKRLDDALEQGERIYAILRGVGAASDGQSRSMLAPSLEGQSLAMKRAYADADVDPNTVGYVECHATGTPVGDASEIRALASVFGSGTDKGIALGSAKPFVGHLRGASGAVGLLRAVLALHFKTIPAQIGFNEPHPNLALETTPFYVPVRQIPLEARGGCPNARAAVSSFGLGGNNYHAVLEAWAPGSSYSSARDTGHSNEPIAIVGLGGVLPNADDVPTFWKSLIQEKDSARDVPEARWAVNHYYDPDPNRNDTTYTRVGCFIEPAPDPGPQFRVPPAARAQIDPGQVIAFRAAEEAVANSKLETKDWDRSRTAVILGFIGCQGRRLLAEARLNFREFEAELEQALTSVGIGADQIGAILSEAENTVLSSLPPITSDTLPGYLGSFNAARIARRFNLQGPHFVVDSACASSLAALHAATRLLRQGVVDTVLLGGVWADGQPEFFVQNCRFSALSASAITPFDERASGFVPGEGAAMLVLRRLSDAERDGQRVHALVRSVEGSTDGAAGRSIYAPSSDGEALAMRRALDSAEVTPDQVDYVECHGTGTVLGDATEVQACTRVYGSRRKQPLLIGSVKSNIGHLMAGAGAAALLKTTLALREGIIPASLKVRQLSSKIDFVSGPVEVVTTARQWKSEVGRPRRAGVSGFGLGGTNFHVILEEYQASRIKVSDGASITTLGNVGTPMLPIVIAQGSDLASCASILKSIAADSQRYGAERFWTSVAASQEILESEPCRIAIVAGEADLLAQRIRLLDSALSKGQELHFLRNQGIFVANADTPRRVAAVFPGQGPQYPNMLRDAAAAFPELVQILDRIDRAYETICGRKLRPSFFTDDPQKYSQNDEDIHCAVFAVNVAIFSLLESYGARIDAVMGQSAGEISALVAARSISLEDGLRTIRERTLAVLGINTSDPGRMVTLTCSADRATQLIRGLPGYAALAADNGPSACIISANREAAEPLLIRAANEGIEAKVLAVSHGYHSQLIAAARPRYREALNSIQFKAPEVELVSSITGDSINAMHLQDYPAHLESQFVEPVRLRQAVTSLHRSGISLFVECGPKWPLTTFISDILAGRPHVAQATIHPKVGEVEQFHRALACLFVHRACALKPSRKIDMTVPNSASTTKQIAEPNSTSESNEPSGETRVLKTLLAIRELIDGALSHYDRASMESETRLIVAPDLRDSSLADNSPLPEQLASAVPATGTAIPAEPVVAAQSGLAPAVRSKDLREHVQSQLLAELVNRTGYPEEMLEPDLDLEAELGIDTVKQVSSLAAVREQYKLAADPKFRMQDARTLRQAVDYIVSRIVGTAGPQPLPPPTNQEKPQKPEPVVPLHAASTTVATIRPPNFKLKSESVSVSDQVHSLLIRELVNRTGYPEDMLDLDLDLEAELGIDTVKQVAALAAIREKFGLPPDPQFRMQDARTIRQALEYLTKRIANANPAPARASEVVNEPVALPQEPNVSPSREQPSAPLNPVAQAQPASESSTQDISAVLTSLQESLKSFALLLGQGKAGPPPTSTSNNYSSADATASHLEHTPLNSTDVPRSAYPELLLESLLPQAECSWNAEVLEMTNLTVTGADSILPEAAPHSADILPLYIRDSQSQIAVNARLIQMGNERSSAPSDMLEAARDGRLSSDESLLHEYLVKSGRANSSPMEWVHSHGFTTTVGGARIRNDGIGSTCAMLSLLGGAYDVASVAWLGLTGVLHSLAAIERICFHRLPQPGDELLICARMAQPKGGHWRADVAIFDPIGGLFAEISGLEGKPFASNGHLHADPANVAWHRFSQRLGRGVAVVGNSRS